MSDKRKHLTSGLAAESLVDKGVVGRTRADLHAVLPDMWLILVGGSLFDRGKDALLPLAATLGALGKKHPIAVCVGGGVRERHTFDIGLDLGLPTGGLAMIAGAIAEQNALIMWALMSQLGAVRLPKEQIEFIPFALAMKQVPVLVAQPPYHYWEYPREDSDVPAHGADCGTVLLAENLGSHCILLKDVEGVFDSDPSQNAQATLIPRIRADELQRTGPKTLPVEPALLEIIKRNRLATRIHVASGLDASNIEKIINGQPAGTILESNHAE